MRDYKGIKILLAIDPFSHRDKAFLPQQEVFWNLRLNHVSFLLSLFLLSQFPERFLSLPLPWGFFGFSFHRGSFHRVGLLLCLPSTSQGQAKIVSARSNLRHSTIYVRGECNFLCSVLLQQKFEATDGPVLQPRVTAQFYLVSKGKYILEA